MTNESVALVVNKLESLAQSIGVGVQEIFPYFVRQQYIDSLSSIIPFILLIITLPLFIYFQRKADWSARESVDQGLTMAFGMLSVILTIVTLVSVDHLLKFLNPEYHAIREIIRLIR